MSRTTLTDRPKSVWDQTVPIVKKGNHTDVYLCDNIAEPTFYDELCHTIHNAEEYETITIHLNTPGGIIDSAFMIIDAIEQSPAIVTAYLTGTVASAGTMIALACEQLIVADHTAFMIHNYSGGMMGKGHEMKARQEFMDASLNATFKTFYSGFLTDKEMTEVIDGKDMWMGKDDILERWFNRQAFLTSELIDVPEEV